MPASNQVTPLDSDKSDVEDAAKLKRDRDKDRKDRSYHRSSSSKHRDKDKDREKDDKERDKGYHRSTSSKDKDKERELDRDREKDKDRDKGYHRSSSSKDKDRERYRDKSYHRSSSSKDKDRDRDRSHHHHSSNSRDKDRDRGYHRSSSGRHRDSDKNRHRHESGNKYKEDMILEEVDGDDEMSDVDKKPYVRRPRPYEPSPVPDDSLQLNLDGKDEAVPETNVDNETDSTKINRMLSPRGSPRSRTGVLADRRQGKRTLHRDSGGTRLNMFFRETRSTDKLADFLPCDDDEVLESISEILFKPYPFQLKIFSMFICFSQFLTLISLFYSLLPCPDEKPSWLVFIGVPLCCAYAGIESIHHMLRYIHLGSGYRILVFLMNLNCLMQLLCVGVVMGKSEDLLTLIGNFVGVAIVLQIDEFLASYIRIRDIDPDLLERKSWRTKMMLKSKMWLIAFAAVIVYGVTVACWRFDSLYCASYKIEDNVNDVDYDQANP